MFISFSCWILDITGGSGITTQLLKLRNQGTWVSLIQEKLCYTEVVLFYVQTRIFLSPFFLLLFNFGPNFQLSSFVLPLFLQKSSSICGL